MDSNCGVKLTEYNNLTAKDVAIECIIAPFSSTLVSYFMVMFQQQSETNSRIVENASW